MVTKRERNLLWYILRPHIYLYLMSISFGRKDGSQRADQHIAMSEIIVNFILCGDFGWRFMLVVHDTMAHLLTDRLDEKIGFPFDRTLRGNEFDVYAEKFFSSLMEIIPSIAEKVSEELIRKNDILRSDEGILKNQ